MLQANPDARILVFEPPMKLPSPSIIDYALPTGLEWVVRAEATRQKTEIELQMRHRRRSHGRDCVCILTMTNKRSEVAE
jgi:hypothetical protein